MNIKDGYVSKRVTLQTQDHLEGKIGRLTSIMSKLTTEDDNQNKQFKHKIYQGKRIDVVMIKEIIKIGIDQTVELGEYHSVEEYNMDKNYRDSPRYNQNCRNDFRRGCFRGNLRSNKNYRGQNLRDGYGRNDRSNNYERGRRRSRERQFSDNVRRNSISSRSRSGSRASINRDQIRCYKGKEYNHFAKDSLTSKIEKETEQVQKMYNMDEEQSSLKL